MQHFDVIVLGAGGVGSAVLDQLARRGVKAVGIDRFRPPHDRGSSHGQTRVIRQAYFEHPDYVPLLKESYRLWRDLEHRTGKPLYHEIGLLQVGPADGQVVPGVLRAAAEHRLAVESLLAGEIMSRWPGLQMPSELVGVFERGAGYLLVEDCVAAHLAAAEVAGSTLMADTEVVGWVATDREVRVQTSRGEITADRLVITAGAWATTLLADLQIKLVVRRKSLFWFATDSADYDVAGGVPVFLFELPPTTRSHALRGNASSGRSASRGEGAEGRGSGDVSGSHAERGNQVEGVFYGFPKLDERGVKFAEHTGGRVVDNPLEVDRSIDDGEQRRLIEVLAAHLPGVSPRVTDHCVCLYTMSPDENFIVDRHPEHANVVFAAGLSGHGFKFAPVLGSALAELALDGTTKLPIEFLSLGRFNK